MMSHVTHSQAEAVLRQVRKTFRPYLTRRDQPVLRRDWDWGYGRCDYAIVWEGGPLEWTSLATGGGIDEELTELGREFGLPPVTVQPIEAPVGVLLECYTSWALALNADGEAHDRPARTTLRGPRGMAVAP